MRPFLSVSEFEGMWRRERYRQETLHSQAFRRAVQDAVDAAYESRLGRSPGQIKSVLTTRLELLKNELSAEEIGEWALEISEGVRVQIRIQGKTPR
jgi:hypothetical protein